MDVKNLDEMISTKKRNIHLFGAGNFRSWMLYFVPGDGTDMHYHANPETFLVLSGSGVVKGLKGEERPIRKNEVLFLEARDGTAGAVRQPFGRIRRAACQRRRLGPQCAGMNGPRQELI
jgi:hypothetical protein